MKIFFISVLSILSSGLVFSQVDTIEYKLNTIKVGDSLTYQFKGKYIVNFNISKNEKWDGGNLRMWNFNNESYIIQRIDKGAVYYINDVNGKRVATLTTRNNGMPNKVIMAEGSIFAYEENYDGSWKATCNGRTHQVIQARGLKKKPTKRKVIVYNQLSDENVVKLFHQVSHLGLLHYTFIKEYEKNFNKSLGLLFLPL